MPAGEVAAPEPFTPRQRDSIQRAIDQAQRTSTLQYSVFVGASGGDPRAYGRRLLGALGPVRAPSHVLIVVDPAMRRMAVLTGTRASLHLDDRATALASMSMTSSFAAGQLAGGIVDGLRTLAEHARQPRTLHTDVET